VSHCEGPCSDFWVLKINSDGTLGCGLDAVSTSTAPTTGVSGSGTGVLDNEPSPTVLPTSIIGQPTSATVGTQCLGGGFVDLEPTGATIFGPPAPGIFFTVENYGTANATNVTVWVRYGDFYTTACSPITVSVPAHSDIGYTVPTSPITPTEYTIVVNPNNTISESNESNNCYDGGSGGCSFPPTHCP
jgi:hypothetical protein